MNSEWGGFGIEKAVFDFMLKNVLPSSVVIELGAGIVSTRELGKIYQLYSVEQYEAFCGLYPNVNYIHAPIIDSWYDPAILREKLPKNAACVLVDGPTKHGPAGKGVESRVLMKNNMDLFNKNSMFIFHDTNRPDEKLLATEIAKQLNKEIVHYDDGDFYSVIYP